MDGNRFDNLAKKMVDGHSRRTVVKMLAGSTFAGALTRFRGGGTAAKPPNGTCQPEPGGKCSDTIPCCNGFCDTGFCPCTAGKVLCHGKCVKPSKFDADPHNCGTCGHVCSKGATCVNGTCDCPEKGETPCPDGCFNLESDEHHCGECGRRCGQGTCCAGVCTDLRSDEHNCGACGKACDEGTVCCAGVCCGRGEACSSVGQCVDKNCCSGGVTCGGQGSGDLCCVYPLVAQCCCDSEPGAGDGFVGCCNWETGDCLAALSVFERHRICPRGFASAAFNYDNCLHDLSDEVANAQCCSSDEVMCCDPDTGEPMVAYCSATGRCDPAQCSVDWVCCSP
jgi:hypothetical protein